MSKVKKLSLEDFKFIYSKVPRLCVDLLIKNEKGVLLTLREIKPYKGFWHLPGGTVLLRETLNQAVKRIAKDELGVEVLVEKQLTAIEFSQNLPLPYKSTISIGFLVKIKNYDIDLNNQASKFNFFHKLPLKIIPSHKDFILKYN